MIGAAGPAAGDQASSAISLDEHHEMIAGVKASIRTVEGHASKLHHMGKRTVSRFSKLMKHVHMACVSNFPDNVIWAKIGPTKVDIMAWSFLASTHAEGWAWWQNNVLKNYVTYAAKGTAATGREFEGREVTVCDTKCLTEVWRSRMDEYLNASYIVGRHTKSIKTGGGGVGGDSGRTYGVSPAPPRLKALMLACQIGDLDVAQLSSCDIVLFAALSCRGDAEALCSFMRSSALANAKIAADLEAAFREEVDSYGTWKLLMDGQVGVSCSDNPVVDRVLEEFLSRSREGACLWTIRVPLEGDETLRDIEELERRGIMVRVFKDRREFSLFRLSTACMLFPEACVFTQSDDDEKRRGCQMSSYGRYRMRQLGSPDDSTDPWRNEAYSISSLWTSMLEALTIATSQQTRATTSVMYALSREWELYAVDHSALSCLDSLYSMVPPPPSSLSDPPSSHQERRSDSAEEDDVVLSEFTSPAGKSSPYGRGKRLSEPSEFTALKSGETSTVVWVLDEDGHGAKLCPNFARYISAQVNIGLASTSGRIRMVGRGGKEVEGISAVVPGAATLSLDMDSDDVQRCGGHQGWPLKLLRVAYMHAKGIKGEGHTTVDRSLLDGIRIRLRFVKPHAYNRLRSSRATREYTTEEDRSRHKWIYESADILCGKMAVITIEGYIPSPATDAAIKTTSEALRFGQIIRLYVARLLSVMAGFCDGYASSGAFGQSDSQEFKDIWEHSNPMFHATVMSVIVTALLDERLEERFAI